MSERVVFFASSKVSVLTTAPVGFVKRRRDYLEMPQAGQDVTNTDKPITECPKNMYKAGYRCVCLNARSVVNKKKTN